MTRTLRALVLVSAAAAALALAEAGRAAQCGLPDAQPWWIEFGSGAVSFRYHVFGRPGIIVATEGGPTVPRTYRRYGVQTVFWQMRLSAIVGTPSAPTDASGIPAAAGRLVARAVEASGGCSTPVIALNELNGASTTTPWTATNSRYRENVLTLLRELSGRGARPFLLLSTAPYTGGAAADWWRAAAEVGDLVPEVYFSGPAIYRQGPIRASRSLRRAFRRAVTNFTELGIPASRVGLTLGFQNTPGGRAGLQPAQAWYAVVKWQALAAKQVARELGIASVWSWGWGTFSSDRSGDVEKAAAACVYLWARDQNLCDGPARAGEGFADSLVEGQIDQLPAGAQCAYEGAAIPAGAVDELTRLTGNRDLSLSALFQRLVEKQAVQISQEDVLAAEGTVVALGFGGRRSAYLAALAKAGATRTVARGLIADELRRARMTATLAAPEPSAAELATFYASYPTTPVRPFRATPAPWWLDRRRTGLALEAVAPARAFAVATGVPTSVRTADGTFSVRALGEPLPLGAYPLSVIRPALRTALQAFARGEAFETWTAKRQAVALSRTICLRDDLPETGAVDFGAYLPFLELNF